VLIKLFLFSLIAAVFISDVPYQFAARWQLRK
jgi:hypothetical protein